MWHGRGANNHDEHRTKELHDAPEGRNVCASQDCLCIMYRVSFAWKTLDQMFRNIEQAVSESGSSSVAQVLSFGINGMFCDDDRCRRSWQCLREMQQRRWHDVCFDPSNRMQHAHLTSTSHTLHCSSLQPYTVTLGTQQMTRTSSHHPG